MKLLMNRPDIQAANKLRQMCVCVCPGFNWMVGVLRKIITEATGTKTETKMPPLLEFFGPEDLKVIIAVSAVSTRGQNLCSQFTQRGSQLLLRSQVPEFCCHTTPGQKERLGSQQLLQKQEQFVSG